jgi:uncharacterized protein YbjQ (UPF0145 family)
MRSFVLVALATTLAGCSSGSITVTGTPRAPIAIEEVHVYAEPPAESEVIALLESSSHFAWTDQGRQDKAVAELKEKAASVGANGIVITAVADSGGGAGAGAGVGVGSGGGGVGISIGASRSSQRVYAKAIFVKREK